MLQRAACNAYTWWCASHIRTKQSKWLEQNLQDMEEKIKNMLNLIEEDGDSFARRAEMYYRRRPELINFVEETYKAYRALADRYDHMSRDLQNANNTIATVFPEQVQFAMEDDDDEISPGGPPFITNENKIPKGLPQPPKLNIPKLPVCRRKSVKNPSKEVKLRKTSSSISRRGATTTSSKSTAEALQEIDRLQKGILALQTEKEFVKSSYEGAVAKYWEIEKQISEMQEKVCSLQDEFGVATVIDDDEARTLMAATALKSCQETLVQLQEKQEKSAEETRVEYQRIKDAHEKLHTIKNEFMSDQIDQSELSVQKEAMRSGSGLNNLEQERLKLESIQEKIREHFDINSDTFLTVTEMAEKIDQLVHEVINLETAVSSQNALIKRLRSETTELQGKLRNLDEKKDTSVKGSDELIKELRKLDKKLSGIQDLHRSVEDQNNNLQAHFTETRCNLSYLSEKLHSVKPDEEIDIPGSPSLGIFCEAQKQKDMVTHDNGFENREVRKEKAEEKKIAIQSLSPYSRENEATSSQSMESSSVCDASKEREHPENQKIVEKQGVSQNKDDIPKVDSESNHNLNHLSQGMSDLNYPGKELHSAKPGEENLHSAKSDEEVQISPQEESGVVIDDAMHAKHEGQEEMMAFSNEPRSSMERKTEVEDKTDEVQDPILSVKNEEDGASSKLSNTTDDISESSEVSGQPDNVEKHNKSETQNHMLHAGLEQKAMEEEGDEPNWQKLFLSGLEDKEKVLLGEYTASLRNYKDAKRKLSELEKENRESTSKMMVQLRELKSANAVKDDEIRSLRQKLGFLQTSFEGTPEATNIESKDTEQGNQHPVNNLLDNQNVEVAETSDVRIANGTMESNPPTEDEEEKIKVILVDEPHHASTIEEKFQRDIDVLLEENLDFWLRFSALVPQIQKFQNSIQDLQIEISKLKDKKKQEGNTSTNKSLKSDARPIYKHLREIQTELTLWLENNAMLKEEIQQRLSAMSQILEEISKVSNSGSETEEVKFSSYQAAKFQGEVLNMQQENNKVADQLQAGVDHARELQDEIEKTLSKLNEDFGLSGPKIETANHQEKQLGNKNRVPLRSFIFGVKNKKQRSFFKCINPTFHKQHSDDLASGLPP